jgi:hypothetical protein
VRVGAGAKPGRAASAGGCPQQLPVKKTAGSEIAAAAIVLTWEARAFQAAFGRKKAAMRFQCGDLIAASMTQEPGVSRDIRSL